MNKIVLAFDFLNGPIYKDVYDARNNRAITGIKEIDNNETITSLNQEMQDLYSSFYDQDKLSEEDSFNRERIEKNIEKLYQMKRTLIAEIKSVLPNMEIEDRTIDFFARYLLKKKL